MKHRTLFPVLLLSLLLSAAPALVAQGHGQPPQQHSQQVTNPDTAADRELSHESRAAAGEAEEEENAQFKHSKTVTWISHKIGVSPEVGYWVFMCINFAIVAGFIYWASKSKLTLAFRERTALIQKGMEEARLATQEANARLEKVQQQLAKLDVEVEAIRRTAETDFTGEEQRIRQAAEEDARRVVQTAQAEIDSTAKSAQRELKSYAAELAVELARKKIQIDPQTDAALVRGFVGELGKDGR